MAREASSKNRPSRKRIPEAIESKLLVESRNTCCICWRSREVQIHHIIPVALGGDNSESNLMVACLNCHSEAHTQKEMAKNLKPRTLRLYKETWLDLVRRHPLVEQSLAEQENDVNTIQEILRQGHRRSLFFPFRHQSPRDMFRSMNSFRLFLQKSGYKLVKNSEAREHCVQLYTSLIEILTFNPGTDRDRGCMHGTFGREAIALLDMKRKKACFHLNELGKLAGYGEEIIAENEFDAMKVEVFRGWHDRKRCFGCFTAENRECEVCEFRSECVELSA